MKGQGSEALGQIDAFVGSDDRIDATRLHVIESCRIMHVHDRRLPFSLPSRVRARFVKNVGREAIPVSFRIVRDVHETG